MIIKKKYITLDLLKVLSMIGVVGNHLFYPIFSRTDFYLGKAWWLSLIIYTLSLVSVPLFIIINGYLLIDKNESMKKTYSRVVDRLLIPAVFWTAFYYIWKYFYRSDWSIVTNISKVVASGSWFIYYFLIALAGLQFLLPVFRQFTKESKSFKKKIFVISIVIGILLHIIEYLIDIPGSINNLFSWWMPFVAYFWFGYLFKQLKFKAKSSRNLFLIWLVFSLFLGYLGMNIKSYNTLIGWHDTGIFYWHAFLSPNIIIMSISLFVWIMKSKAINNILKNKTISKTIAFLSPLSYGVYLTHPFVIDYVDIHWNYAIEFVSNSLSKFVIQRTLLVFIISYAVSFIINKLPIINKTVGIISKTNK